MVRGLLSGVERESRSELDILLTERRAIDLVGRHAELDQLSHWLHSTDTISFWCVSGRGGAGKTRLGIELCETAAAFGWDAGFIRDAELKRFHSSQNLADWRWGNPTLVVVDYAAASIDILTAWLDEVGSLLPSADRPPLRFLFLEREADPAFGWWSRLVSRSGLTSSSPSRLAAATEPLRLLPIETASDRRAVMQQAMDQAASLLGRLAPPMPPPGTDAKFEKRLGEAGPDKEPLYLAMAGLTSAREGLATALSLDRGELARHVAANEQRRLERLARSWGLAEEPGLITRVVASVTLQGGCDRGRLVDLIDEERRAIGDRFPISSGRIAEHLAGIMGTGENGQVEAIQPDLIGEAFILITLEQIHQADVREAVVQRAWHRAGGSVAASLIRMAQDFAQDDGHCSVKWLTGLVANAQSGSQIVELAELIPESSLALRRLGASLQGVLVRMARHIYETDPSQRLLLASNLNNYAVRLEAVGRSNESLEAIEEAIDLLRPRAAEEAPAVKADLPLALINLSSQYFMEGRLQDALAAATEAVGICRGIVGDNKPGNVAALAMSLNSRANALCSLGQRQEAFENAQECLDLYRGLAERSLDWLADLAGSLTNYAARLGDLGRGKEGLEAICEATEVYRELVATDADAHLPGLAMALLNRMALHSALGEDDSALQHGEEAVQIYLRAFASNPDAFRTDLAKALSMLADQLEANGKVGRALDADRRAINLLVPVHESSPGRARPAIGAVAGDYLRRCMRNGAEVDEALLETLFAAGILQRPAGDGA